MTPKAHETAGSPEGPRHGLFLKSLKAEERHDLERSAARRPFARGTTLMVQHDSDRSIIVLTKGRAKVARCADGREVLLSIRDPGDVLGEIAYLGGSPRVANVTALDDGEALTIRPTALRRVLREHPRLTGLLLEIVASRFREETLHRVSSLSSDTLGRLAARIVELADRYGQPAADGIHVQLPFPQDELAAWVGASRAGVARGLQDLRSLGWVRTGRGEVLVSDIGRLRARAA